MYPHLELCRDEYGYPIAIAINHYFLIHLQSSLRTMDNIERIVAILNIAIDIANSSTNNPKLNELIEQLFPSTQERSAQSIREKLGWKELSEEQQVLNLNYNLSQLKTK